MNIVTARYIKNGYPEKIKIVGTQSTNDSLWMLDIYLTDGERILRKLLSHPPHFKSRGLAEEHGKLVCESIVSDKELK